jgi:dihydrofolate reductase
VDELLSQTMGEQVSGSSDLLLGRKTLEIFASYWSGRIMKITGPASTKQQNMLFRICLPGMSGNLIRTLFKHDLVDEFWLRIFPITLDTGKRLFAQGTMTAASRLHEAETSPSGVIVATCKRAGEVKQNHFK